ncbi:MAG: cyclic nucleotide-binding domain-containing protein [Nitrospirae bacterium]|nr:MAG: cyclic nucleotide-binding domain-containing protein [Nitrospirota bacterium]
MRGKVVNKENFKDGQTIFKEGTFGESTYIVLSGNVNVFKKINGEDMLVATLGKDDLFGEIRFAEPTNIIDEGRQRFASVVASGDVQIGVLDKDFLDSEWNKTSSEFRLIMRALTERLKKTTAELINVRSELLRLKSES